MIEVNKKKLCNGCHACLNICPVNFLETKNKFDCLTMEKDNEGFKYPKVSKKECIECNACVEVCPLLKKEQKIFKDPKTYACYNKDEKIRMESSSGGIFTLLAEKVLGDKGVVFGAAFNEELNLKHRYIEHKSELGDFRGSKYLQSEIGDTFKQVFEFLKGGRKVLFSGTPCQVGGLKSYLEKKSKIVNYNNLLCVDFICHGVPSPKVWGKYKEFISKEHNKNIKRVSFRDKSQSWKKYNTKFTFENSEKSWLASTDKYMRAFLTDICLRPACHDCGFKSKGRISDITMADFWGIQRVAPDMDDDKGTSLILVHSEQGDRYYSDILQNVASKEVNVDAALRFNSAAIKSCKPHLKRDDYFKNLDSLEFDDLHNKYVKLPFIIRNKKKMRSFVGKVLRKIGLKK